jgi:hypothetical protein
VVAKRTMTEYFMGTIRLRTASLSLFPETAGDAFIFTCADYVRSIATRLNLTDITHLNG